MPNAPKPGLARIIIGLAAAAILAILGVAAVAQGLDGRATVVDALKAEKVVGTPTMTPAAIAEEAKKRGVSGLQFPTCSVAGEPVDDGASARCFAQYMRVDSLLATGGKTYAEMPRFATEDGKGTNDPSAAQTLPSGEPMNNPARQVWVTSTALSSALNMSYMAQQVSLFGIAVGAAFLVLGLAVATLTLTAVRRPQRAPALAAEPALQA